MTKNIKLAMHTADLSDEKFLALQDLFPEAVTETITTNENGEKVVTRAIDAEVLQQLINKKVVSGKEERYQFTWPDKKKAMLLANAPINKTLRPCREESVDFDNTENLYIEGDNLDVLKLLRETYLGKIKMIYIDPPYNTGNDFVYEDDFAEDTQEFLRRDNQIDEQGNRLVTNTESNGRFHTDWLNMMYPRLKLARDLLSEDGVVFVSIDYNEFSNLKKILDEIFGKENFQREIIWRIGWLSGYKTTASNFIRNHDTIFMYSKNSTKFNFNKKYILNNDFKPLVKSNAQLTEKFANLGINKRSQDLILNFINHENRPEKYPIEDTWNCNEYDDLNSIAIVSFTNEKISKILEINQEFKGQKSVKMLKRILESNTNNEDIILDFFSGTSSTAHAVIELNANDGGNRKFIMVQIPESTGEFSEAFKAGYENICEIGRERIRRVGTKIKEDMGLTAQSLDIGFRVLKLDESNMNNVFYSPDEYKEAGFKFEDLAESVKLDRTHEDILFQVMLELGVPLSAKINVDRNIIAVDDNYLVACFDKVDSETVTRIAKMTPYYAVFRDSSFINDSSLINVDQIFNTYSPTTKRRVI